EQPPVVDQVGAYVNEVGRQVARPLHVACEAVGRLVDANDEVSGKLSREVQGGEADATAGIEYQWHAAVVAPGGKAGVECGAIVVGDGFPEDAGGVPGNLLRQVLMHAWL